jgi:hypothetical protein
MQTPTSFKATEVCGVLTRLSTNLANAVASSSAAMDAYKAAKLRGDGRPLLPLVLALQSTRDAERSAAAAYHAHLAEHGCGREEQRASGA